MSGTIIFPGMGGLVSIKPFTKELAPKTTKLIRGDEAEGPRPAIVLTGFKPVAGVADVNITAAMALLNQAPLGEVERVPGAMIVLRKEGVVRPSQFTADEGQLLNSGAAAAASLPGARKVVEAGVAASDLPSTYAGGILTPRNAKNADLFAKVLKEALQTPR
jgi:hypothetical protein